MHFPAKTNGRTVLAINSGGAAKSLRLDSPAGWDAILGGSQRSVGLDPATAYAFVGFVRRCVTVRANRVASLPWAVYPEGAEPGDTGAALYTSEDPAPPDRLASLARLRQCLALTEASVALSGAAYHLILMDDPGQRNGDLMRFRGFQYFRADRTEPDFDGSGNLLQFYHTVGSKREPFPVESVLHVWPPDPLRETGPGTADAAAAGLPARALYALATFLGDHLEGGLIKATVLSQEGEARFDDEEQAAEAKRAWWDFLRRGPKATGGPPILDGLEATVIGGGLKDLANAKLTEEQRQAICTAFGVPWALMMDSAANFATASVHERAFILDTIAPNADHIADTMNAQLLSRYGLALRFEPGRSEVMQQFEVEKAQKIAALVGSVYTREEARMLMGLPPEPSAGVFAVPETAPPEPEPGGDGATRSLPSAPPVLSVRESVARVLAGDGAY